MKDLLDKLSSYNLFNYLLPGTLFVAAARRVTEHQFASDNVAIDLFGFYFIGLVISRFGSLVIGPLLEASKFVSFARYHDYIDACQRDAKVELLSEQNNMYRTLAALFVALLLFKGADALALRWHVGRTTQFTVGCAALFVVFALAYRKQTGFIVQRVTKAKGKTS